MKAETREVRGKQLLVSIRTKSQKRKSRGEPRPKGVRKGGGGVKRS